MDIEKDYACLERNKIVYHKIIDCDEDYQETLQQYSDDIFRVVKCESKSSIISVNIETDKVIINGKTDVYLTYYNENSQLCYADFDRDFCKKISIDNLSSNAFVSVVPRDRYTNFRVVNQRRIDVHISLGLDTIVFDKYSVPCLSSCEKAKLKVENIDTYNFSFANYSKIEFDEDFEVSVNSKSINKIISHTSNVSLKEYKIIKDKVLIKVELSILAIYTTEDDECIEKVAHSFSLSKIVDVTGIDEEDVLIPNISVGSLYLKSKNINSDSINTIEAYGDICVYNVFIKKEKKSVITDGYVMSKKSSCSYSNCAMISKSKHIKDNISDNISFTFNTEFSEIIDLSISINNVYLISNKLNVKLLAKAFCKSSDGGYCFITSENTLYISCDEYKNHISGISIESFDFNIESKNSISTRLNLLCNSFLYNESNVSILSDLQEHDESIHYPAMTLYFGKRNESIWQIAKQFSSDIDNIMTENDLTNDVLETNKLLYIPGM